MRQPISIAGLTLMTMIVAATLMQLTAPRAAADPIPRAAQMPSPSPSPTATMLASPIASP